jgi:hypothetical protein
MKHLERYCGIELAGSRSRRTSLVILDYYVSKKRLFLLDVFDHMGSSDDESADQVLLKTLSEFSEDPLHIGVSAPLTLPPCMTCTRAQCPLPSSCEDPQVKWMRNVQTDVFPYVQRPAELFVRDIYPTSSQVHDVLGANTAPLTMRAQFLQKHLHGHHLYEAHPRLTLYRLAPHLHIRPNTLKHVREIELGIHHRMKVLEALIKHTGIFIYQKDIAELVRHMSAFDAFFVAITAFLAKHKFCDNPPEDYPGRGGWVHVPRAELSFKSVIE